LRRGKIYSEEKIWELSKKLEEAFFYGKPRIEEDHGKGGGGGSLQDDCEGTKKGANPGTGNTDASPKDSRKVET